MASLSSNTWGLNLKLDSEWTGRRSSNHIVDMEIDRSSSGFQSYLHDVIYGGEKAIVIYKLHEVPEFLQTNQYIINGYRSTLPFSQCIQSLFLWSNESINIWSHLIGFVIFLYLLLWDNAVGIAQVNGNIVDHIVLSVALLCFQCCMLCSVGYHVFRCQSERSCRQWLAMDMTGISIGLIGIFLPGVHYGFYCLSVWRDVYLLTITVIFVAILLVQSRTSFNSSRHFQRQLFIYCGLVAYGIVPTAHWVYLNGGLSTQIVEVFVPRVVTMYILAGVAFVIYMSKCPERCRPGQFDYIGCSHQWWHVIVVVAFYYWHDAGLHFLQYRAQQDHCA